MINGRKTAAWCSAAAILLTAGCSSVSDGGAGGAGPVRQKSTAARPYAHATIRSGAAAAGGPWFQSVQMTSATDGSALYYPQNPASPAGPLLLLARTTDAARTWADVTPPGARAILSPANSAEALDPVDAKHAYLAVTSSTDGAVPVNTTALFATANGGLSWTESRSFETSGPAVKLAFAGPRAGWLLPDTAFGGQGRPKAWLYRTVDGGLHWSSLAAPPPGQWLGGNDFCRPMALAFVSTSTGWLTVSCRSGSRLFASHDGGATWSVQALPVPIGLPGRQSLLTGPQFAGGAGFLTVAPESSPPVLLGSQDSGQTWQSLPVPPGAGQFPQVTFFTARHGILVTGGAQSAIGDVIYLTGDGGQSWTPVLQGRHFTQYGAAVEFTSPQAGLAWILGGDWNGATPPPVYVTGNSGRSWTSFTPKLVR
jgi:photosystem II stability/assembly factor-like uncharacterized protein